MINLPNILTLLRILLIPVFVIFVIEHRFDLALLTFTAAGISDGLDGLLARALRQKTTLGAYTDPIADKLLLSTSFVTLAVIGLLPAWLAVVVVSRDVIIMGGILVLMLVEKKVSIRPTFASKLTTLCQLVTVFFYLAHDFLAPYWFLSRSLVNLTALMTLLSGFQYILIGATLLGQPNHGVGKR
ncbi:MAG: CDP-alcohol phosphatidyltransferase family protein [Thermodesulfobacteriota bacterium]